MVLNVDEHGAHKLRFLQSVQIMRYNFTNWLFCAWWSDIFLDFAHLVLNIGDHATKYFVLSTQFQVLGYIYGIVSSFLSPNIWFNILSLKIICFCFFLVKSSIFRWFCRSLAFCLLRNYFCWKNISFTCICIFDIVVMDHLIFACRWSSTNWAEEKYHASSNGQETYPVSTCSGKSFSLTQYVSSPLHSYRTA